MTEENPDTKPLIEDEEKKDEEKASTEEEQQDSGKGWRCCAGKCFLLFVAILGIVVFVINCYTVMTLYDNEYFDSIYPTVYLVLMLGMLAAIIIWIMWMIAEDSPGSRKTFKWGFLIFGVASILIGIWVLIYICFMYPHEKVYVKD